MMCLAVPAQVIECEEEQALVDLQGNRLRISRVLTPEAAPGDWVLVHAGFSISTIREPDALETWRYLRSSYGGDMDEIVPSEAETS
ncbi:MAG: HypC/HybG/HupF family hydrogenase formation chaperone [Planctomycetota bacterium]